LKKLLFCTHKVNRANIRRENRKGVEHIVLTSFTLPPNIVMNGGLYSIEEIDKSFKSLNRTPVTVEHPEIDGVFVSANDPEIDFEFRFGAFNENARKLDDGRVALDKVINVQKALMTEKGKRLLDRIEEIETNEKARPIHTSVGLFVEVEEVSLSTNARGQEYTWIARDIIFDHDAILLDSIGASTPDQGTGIGINKESVKVSHYICGEKKRKVKAKNHITNQELSFSDIEQKLYSSLNQGLEAKDTSWIVSVFDDAFIYETSTNELFKSNYELDELGNLAIHDTRLPVERVVEYRPINPIKSEDNAMRDTIIEQLKQLGITVNADISDSDLMKKYNESLLATNKETSEVTDVSELVKNAVTAAIEPLNSEISNLKTTITANSNKELSDLATSIVNSGKYPAFEQSDILDLGLEKAKALAANCGVTHSIGSTMLINEDKPEILKTNIEDLPE